MKMSEIKKGLFGEIAISKKFMTRKQLEECLAEQKTSAVRRRIGELCIEKGYLTPVQVQAVLDEQVALLNQISHPNPIQ